MAKPEGHPGNNLTTAPRSGMGVTASRARSRSCRFVSRAGCGGRAVNAVSSAVPTWNVGICASMSAAIVPKRAPIP